MPKPGSRRGSGAPLGWPTFARRPTIGSWASGSRSRSAAADIAPRTRLTDRRRPVRDAGRRCLCERAEAGSVTAGCSLADPRASIKTGRMALPRGIAPCIPSGQAPTSARRLSRDFLPPEAAIDIGRRGSEPLLIAAGTTPADAPGRRAGGIDRLPDELSRSGPKVRPPAPGHDVARRGRLVAVEAAVNKRPDVATIAGSLRDFQPSSVPQARDKWGHAPSR